MKADNARRQSAVASNPETTGCACLAGSTYGTADPAIRRCDLCGGIVPADRVTGEYEDATPVPQTTGPDIVAQLRAVDHMSIEDCFLQSHLLVEIVAAVLADGRGAGADGKPRVGRQTRKKAQEVLAALRAAGWRVLR
jgi:hypothetical protein